MKLGRILREKQVASIADSIKRYNSFFVVNFSNVKVNDFNQLRSRLFEKEARMFTVRNNLARIAMENAGISDMQELVDGSCAFVFLGEDIVGVSGILVGFSREFENFRIKGGYFNQKALSSKDIEALSKLPPLDVLRAHLVMTMKMPITGFVCSLKNILNKLVWTLNAVKEKKEGQK